MVTTTEATFFAKLENDIVVDTKCGDCISLIDTSWVEVSVEAKSEPVVCTKCGKPLNFSPRRH